MTIHLVNGFSGMCRRALPFCLLAHAALFAAANLAFGQVSDEGVRMDNIELLESSRPILEYIIAGFCIFGTLAMGFKSSNRAQGT